MQQNLGFEEALALVLENVGLGPEEEAALPDLPGRVLVREVRALVDSPSVEASLKDGYALHSADVASASEAAPVALRLAGFQAAGDIPRGTLPRGATLRVTTGTPLPSGADAVLAGEFAREEAGWVHCFRDAGPNRNVLSRGADVRAGEVIAGEGEVLTPGLIGLIAAGGLSSAPVVRPPRVALLGTGDEVVAPGRPLGPGKLYASNIVETAAWLKAFGFPDAGTQVLPDRAEEIASALRGLSDRADAFISSGGAWGSERDLMVRLLGDLGWRGIFHRVRLGPGKAVAFGLWDGRPFFILPGGPPSHEAAFLLLALPGLWAMCGRREPVFPRVMVRLTEAVAGQAKWTQVIHARAVWDNGRWTAAPLKTASRLSSMARKNALILLPEGVSEVAAGQEVEAVLLGARGLGGIL
ncbi:MAG: molybdopterin molybdotransferase MoeA [Thermodesulfobacteriota bacterium]